MLLSLKRLGGLHRPSRLALVGRRRHDSLSKKGGKTTFLNGVTTFPQAGLVSNESFCMQRKSSNATSGGSPPRKQTQSFNDRNHEGADAKRSGNGWTSERYDHRNMRQKKCLHICSHICGSCHVPICSAASSVIEQAARWKSPPPLHHSRDTLPYNVKT